MRILTASVGLTPTCVCVAEPQNEQTDLDDSTPRRFVHSEGCARVAFYRRTYFVGARTTVRQLALRKGLN